LNEFEELLSAEHLYSPGKPIQIHHKRINSCDSQRLNSGEAKVLDNILDKYFSGSAPITANQTMIHHQQYQEQEQQATQEETPAPTQLPTQAEGEQIITEEIQQPVVKEKKLKKKRSLGTGEKKAKGTKQPKVILNTSNLSSMTDLVKETNSAVQSPVQKVQQSPLDKILSGSSSLTFKHLDMITNPNLMKAGANQSIKSDSNVNFESTLKDTRKNSEVSSHFETDVKSPTEAYVDYSQFSKFTKNPRSVSFASGKSSSMKTLPEQPVETQEAKKTLSKSKTTTSKSKITAKSSPKKSAATSSKPRSNSKKEAKSTAATPTTTGKLDVLSLLKPTTKKAKF